MPVQVQTLSLISAVQALALALMLWIGTHGGDRQALAGMRLRAAALAVEALAYGLLTVHAWISPAVLLLGGNALNLLAQAMAVLALRMMLGEPLRRRLVGAIAVIGWLGVAWFGMVHMDYRLRVLWGTVAIVCNMALNIQVLAGGCHRGGSRARCVLMWFCVLSIALLVWRNGALWLGSNQPNDIGTPVATNVFYILLAGMQPLFASISFLLLYNEILQEELHQQARIDPLTGVANRLALGEAATSLLAQPEIWRGSLGVLIIDADHFKSVNDRFGHDGGDTVLRALVSSIQRMLRAGDVIGRFGGEEFVVLSPGGELAGTLALAERIRAQVATTPLTIDGHEIQLTVSIGATAAMAGERDMAAILRRADKALYAAKREGRNRVMRG